MSDVFFLVKMVNPSPQDVLLMTQLCGVLDCRPTMDGPKTSRNRGRRPLTLAAPPPAEDPADPIESWSDEDAPPVPGIVPGIVPRIVPGIVPPPLPVRPVSPVSSCSSQELMVPMDVVSSSGDDQDLMVPMDVVSSSGDNPPPPPLAHPLHGPRWSQAFAEALERYRSEAEQDEE